MEIISGIILAVLGWLVYNKFIDNKLSESEQNKVLDFKQKQITVDVETLKKTLAEQKTGQELSAEEVEKFWKKEDK